MVVLVDNPSTGDLTAYRSPTRPTNHSTAKTTGTYDTRPIDRPLHEYDHQYPGGGGGYDPLRAQVQAQVGGWFGRQ